MRLGTVALLAAVAFAAVATAACADDDGGSTARRRGAGGGADGEAGEVENPNHPGAKIPVPEGTRLGERRLRRLTRREYESSVRDALGLGAEWKGPELTADRASELGFDNDASLLELDEARTAEHVAAAEVVAEVALAQGKLAALPACAQPSRACATSVVDGLGARLFRRAPTDEERARYLAAFDEIAKLTTPRDGLKWVLVALLDSPHFLYRHEIGVPVGPDRAALTGEELATELAYTFGGTLPSPELLERGRRGELDAADVRVEEAKTLLRSPRGRELLTDFLRQWLRYADVKGIAKDAAVVPDFARVRDDMAEETRRFFDALVFEKRGSVRDLFTSADAYVTPALAAHYGIAAPAGAGPAQRPPDQSIGILAHGSLLARYALTGATSPSQRGAFVRRKLLCQPLPDPPPNVGEPPVPQPGLTTRELYEKIHAAQPSCKGCHGRIDPIGFGLEHFDVAGRFRREERGKPVDPRGEVSGLPSRPDGVFSDHRALAALLADAPEVADCVGGLLAAYAYGTAEAREYTLPEAREAMRRGSTSLFDYFAGLAAAPSFAIRKR